MFGKIAGFEFRYQIRQPVFWVVALIFFLLTFGVVTIDQIRVGGVGPSDHKNGPYALSMFHLVWTVFYMFVTTAFVANIVVRDDETGYGPIIRSTRINKFDYLYGRFLGAFAAVAVSFLAVPLGVIVGSFAPWVDRETLGALQPMAFVSAYLFLALPGLLLTSSVFFSLATVTRSLMWTYVGVICFMVLWTLSSILFGKPEFEQASAFFEPFGLGAYGLVTKYWTPAERNSLLPPLEGVLLYNRLIVLGVSAGFLALAYSLFRFHSAEQSGRKGNKARRLEAAAKVTADAPPPALRPRPKPRFGAATAWSQLVERTRLDMRQVFGSPAYSVLMALGLANAVGGLWFTAEETRYGGAVFPVTRILIPVLQGSFGLIPIIIAVFYAGELVWRERDRKTHELIDSTPVPDWAFVAPKTLAISLVLLSTLVISVLAAVGVQLSQGYQNLELGKYFLWYVLPMAVDWTLLAILAVFLQTIVPHKFIGWGLMLLLIISRFALPNMGAEDYLYRFGMGPGVPLSDMNGQGSFWIGAWWLRLYWSAFSLVLLVLSYALWRRGTESRLAPRLKRLPRRLSGGAGLTAALALAVFAGSGAFIYLNTHVWNEYRTRNTAEKDLADAEKALLRYEHTPQPTITAVKLDVDIRPDERKVTTRGVYTLENLTGAPLREIHVLFEDRDAKVLGLYIPGTTIKQSYERFNYRIFRFDTPMLPGETRTMAFTTEIGQRGFRNTGNIRRVAANGTFLNNAEIAPFLGFSRSGLLSDRARRKKQGLNPDMRMASLGTPGADKFNYLRHDSDLVKADITVTTSADQTPIAPGYSVSDTLSGGRRTVHFVSDTPIMNFFSVQSARYQVKRETYKGVQLAVYYDPQHPWNAERMLTSQKLTLDYAQAAFTPYQFRQVRFIEFPDYEQFAQAFAGTIPWSEGLFFIADYHDPEKVDMVTYVGAHEIGHQWWAHQLVGADEQGATSLSETLAQYTAMMVMKHRYGDEQVVKFLKFELDSYLRARGGDPLGESTLSRVEVNQGYIHYRKGSLVMYRLQDELGEEAINRALRGLLEKFAYKRAPFPTSRDLVAALRAVAPADKQQLITDLFEKITLYDVKTKTMKVAKRADGRFDVTLTVEARKLYADAKGKETASPMAENLYVGLFTAKPGKKAFNKGSILVLERRPIRSGTQTLTFVTDKAPTFGGVDPYNILIDRNSDDNVVAPN